MISQPLFSSAAIPPERTYTLWRNVPAIQVLPDSSQPSSLGLMTQLPEGTQIDIGGPGFNDRTVKVRCGGSAYYVFLEDLEPQRKRAASASSAG